jgi:catechol 2,3-dioxygenase-like lactoylglutathione lyase family enzyme
MNFKLEVVMLGVSDVDRAKEFYQKLGWRLDADYSAPDGDFRVIQFTPPGSGCSIAFGTGVTTTAPGSIRGLELVVTDIEAARAEIAGRGIEVGEVYHDAKLIHHASSASRVPGPDPQRRSYLSFADFSDPDGNQWILQEITQRLPGR